MSGKDYNLLTASDFDRWLISVYYATTTTLTIGGTRGPLPSLLPWQQPPGLDVSVFVLVGAFTPL